MKYFDNAATGFPKSKSVINEITSALYTCGNPGRSDHRYSLIASEILYSAREAAANLFSSSPEKIVLCTSATYALNMSIKGLYKSGTKILISDLEHNSVYRPSASVGGVEIFSVNLESDEKTIQNFKNKFDKNISLVVITHASNTCGRVLPAEEIATLCHEKGVPIILDASQTAGYIPIKISKSKVDIICIPGHKGLYGPMGTGALIINPKSILNFNTIIEGGSGIMSESIGMPDDLPERLEAGTCAVHDFAGMKKALEICEYDKTCFEKNEYTLNELTKIDGLKIYGFSKLNSPKYMPLILFNSERLKPSQFSELLSQKDFCVRSGFHCSPLAHKKLNTGPYGAVRISIGKNNSFKECKQLVEAIRQIHKNA